MLLRSLIRLWSRTYDPPINVQYLISGLPASTWFRDYRAKRDLPADIIAGLTVGSLVVPQSMAYAILAGLPPVMGLYAAGVAAFCYPLFGSSRQLSVGPVAVVSLLTFEALRSLPDMSGSESHQLAAASFLALLVGFAHLVMAVARLGGLTSLLSRPVIVGFTAAVALIIAVNQVDLVLGVDVDAHHQFLARLVATVAALTRIDPDTAAVGCGSIIVLVALKRMNPRFPAALVVMGVAMAGTAAFGIDKSIEMVGAVPRGLPTVGFSPIPSAQIWYLLPRAFIIMLVGVVESVAVAQIYSNRYGYRLNPQQELVALGAANIGSGVFGGYAVTGSLSRTAVNGAAGARTPLAGAIAAFVVLTVLLAFTPVFAYLPTAVLGAVVVVAVIGLVDIGAMRSIAAVHLSDTLVLAVAFITTLVLGVEWGIGVAVLVSLAVIPVRVGWNRLAPSMVGRAVHGLMVPENDPGQWNKAVANSGTIVVVDAPVSICFVTVPRFRSRVSTAAEQAVSGSVGTEAERRHVIVNMARTVDVDSTGLELLETLHHELIEKGVVVHLAALGVGPRAVLERSGQWKELDRRVHPTMHDAIGHLGRASFESYRVAPNTPRLACLPEDEPAGSTNEGELLGRQVGEAIDPGPNPHRNR